MSYDFNCVNQNKLSVWLDLTRPESVAIVRYLARTSDVVAEKVIY